MRLHFEFSEWENNEVEVYRTLDDGATFGEVVEVFEHFLSMAYGYPIKLQGGHNLEDVQQKLDLEQ